MTLVHQHLQSKHYQAGEFIVKHNEIASELFFIISGEVDIIDANELVFARGYAGEFFGELGLVYSIPRTASVRAATPVEVCSLSKSDFLKLQEQVPSLKSEVHRSAMERLRRFQKELVRLTSIPEGTRYTEKQLQVFKEVFFYWDRNNDQILDSNDLGDLISALSGKEFSPEEIKQIVRMLDHDKDGVVSFDDFVMKIRTLRWFLEPREGLKIKKELSLKREVDKRGGLLDVEAKSLGLGICIGVFAALVPVVVSYWLGWWHK
uniref:Calmodulin n=1 Tax=Arcella intermedia TaxID=1963864 RepID=A0A6B2LDC9_9EUKA